MISISGNKKIIIIASILVLAVFGIAGREFFLKQTAQEPKSDSGSAESLGLKPAEPNYDILALDYVLGKIQELGQAKLIVKVNEQENNPFLQNRVFEVIVDIEKTKIFSLPSFFQMIQDEKETKVIAMDFSADDKIEPVEPLEIAFGDLSAGDDVIILSYENIKVIDFFTAKAVYKLGK